MKSRTPLTVGALAAIIIGVVVALGALRTPAPAVSPSPSVAIGTQAPSTPVKEPPGVPSAAPTALAAAAWSRGIYLQTIDKAAGFTPANTRLIMFTRAQSQRVEVHNEIAWISTGPWSPDGTAVIATDRSSQSYVIWPDNSLTKLEGASGAWTWLDVGTVGGVVTSGGFELIRVDARSGKILKRDSMGSAALSGATVGPKGDWIAYSTSVPDGPGEAVTASTTQRVASGPRTHPAGWLPDGGFVFVRQAAVSTVEVRDPARPDSTVLGQFGNLVQALAQPSSPVIVVHDLRANQISTLRGAVQRLVPLQSVYAAGNTLEGISRDGRTMTFSGGNAPVGTLAGTIDLETGAFTYMCDTGCWRLAVN